LRSVWALASITTALKCSMLKAFHSLRPSGEWKVTSPVLTCTALINAVRSEKPPRNLGVRPISP
jgi:hypothetical protein